METEGKKLVTKKNTYSRELIMDFHRLFVIRTNGWSVRATYGGVRRENRDDTDFSMNFFDFHGLGCILAIAFWMEIQPRHLGNILSKIA